jgi:hypothetical protein
MFREIAQRLGETDDKVQGLTADDILTGEYVRTHE